MRICIVGSGVIGCIYGYVFAESGHDVTHYVLHGHGATLRHGIDLNLLDARRLDLARVHANYSPRIVEALDPAHSFDLILASVRHYQLPALLPVLARDAGDATILFFNNLWTSFEPVDAALRGRYVWGFPAAGGGFEHERLSGALLGDVRLGEPTHDSLARFGRLERMFLECGLSIDLHDDMLDWLWTHFAVEAGVMGGVIRVGGATKFLKDASALAPAARMVRDALAVVRARGVELSLVADVQRFLGPEMLIGQSIEALYATDRAARTILEHQRRGDDMVRIFRDVLDTGRALSVNMPSLMALEPAVQRFEWGSRRPSGTALRHLHGRV
jgi:2-dehydropantoate 2-reductase